MDLIKALNWRYATKRMSGDKIPEKQLEQILEAIRLAPSSYGLQPFEVTIIENKEILSEIYEKACPQVVLQQCSQLLVFRARTRVEDDLVDDYVHEMKNLRNASEEDSEKFRQKIKYVQENPLTNKLSWAIRQTYIALGYGTFAAAQLGIDTTPIEGFSSVVLNQILGLDTEKEEAVVLLALGYRDVDSDKTVKLAKIRRPFEKMFKRI